MPGFLLLCSVKKLWKGQALDEYCRATSLLASIEYDYKAVQAGKKRAVQTFSIQTTQIVDTIIVKVLNLAHLLTVFSQELYIAAFLHSYVCLRLD